MSKRNKIKKEYKVKSLTSDYIIIAIDSCFLVFVLIVSLFDMDITKNYIGVILMIWLVVFMIRKIIEKKEKIKSYFKRN